MLYLRYRYVTTTRIKVISFERSSFDYLIRKYYNTPQDPDDIDIKLESFKRSKSHSLEWRVKGAGPTIYNVITSNIDKYINSNNIPENDIKSILRQYFLKNILD